MKSAYYFLLIAASMAMAVVLAGCTGNIPVPAILTQTIVTTNTEVSTATSTEVKILPVCQSKIPAGCPKVGEYYAIDMAVAATDKLLDTLSCAGIKTIIRYYDWPGQESLKGKIPLADEIERIKKRGFKMLFVFQHFNSSFSTFQDSKRPAKDVSAILELAKRFKQPKGTGIYVGVDGDFGTVSQQTAIRKYFEGVSKPLREAGFKVGMYGGGANCVSLQKAGLIDLPCWIAASSWKWTGTKDVLDAGNFGLKQKVNQSCEGKSLDYNSISAKNTDIGDWHLP